VYYTKKRELPPAYPLLFAIGARWWSRWVLPRNCVNPFQVRFAGEGCLVFHPSRSQAYQSTEDTLNSH
jgi:hypothetical protein